MEPAISIFRQYTGTSRPHKISYISSVNVLIWKRLAGEENANEKDVNVSQFILILDFKQTKKY